jgi:hypothetical protein
VPKNTPVEIVERLNKEINAGLADEKLSARLADLGGKVLPGSSTDFGKLIADDSEKSRQASSRNDTTASRNHADGSMVRHVAIASRPAVRGSRGNRSRLAVRGKKPAAAAGGEGPPGG